jgi:hypothetical protein
MSKGKRIIDVKIDPEKLNKLNRFVLQENFNNKVLEVSKLNLSVIQKPSLGSITINDSYSAANSVLDVIGSVRKIPLNQIRGQNFSKKIIFGGYDESKFQFVTLEGVANITSHSLVEVTNREYLPVGYITVYFYTRSKAIVDKTEHVRYSLNADADSNSDYAKDRNHMILESVIENSILFIDGPFIGGNITNYSLKLVQSLHKKNVIPVFFVKNSDSNLVVDNFEPLKTKFNSDLHWSYNFLKPGERTNFFLYTDKVNPKNKKLFCYFKAFDHTSPQRIEFSPETFDFYESHIDELFDLIYYLMLVQGDKSNPQIRPVAIAEKYAREMIKTVNIRSMIRNTSLIPTMNQERFGG